MSVLVFGEADPRLYNVPESECMACRHSARGHWTSDTTTGPACEKCDCERHWCYVHDALDGEHDCGEDGEW